MHAIGLSVDLRPATLSPNAAHQPNGAVMATPDLFEPVASERDAELAKATELPDGGAPITRVRSTLPWSIKTAL